MNSSSLQQTEPLNENRYTTIKVSRNFYSLLFSIVLFLIFIILFFFFLYYVIFQQGPNFFQSGPGITIVFNWGKVFGWSVLTGLLFLVSLTPLFYGFYRIL